MRQGPNHEARQSDADDHGCIVVAGPFTTLQKAEAACEIEGDEVYERDDGLFEVYRHADAHREFTSLSGHEVKVITAEEFFDTFR